MYVIDFFIVYLFQKNIMRFNPTMYLDLTVVATETEPLDSRMRTSKSRRQRPVPTYAIIIIKPRPMIVDVSKSEIETWCKDFMSDKEPFGRLVNSWHSYRSTVEIEPRAGLVAVFPITGQLPLARSNRRTGQRTGRRNLRGNG